LAASEAHLGHRSTRSWPPQRHYLWQSLLAALLHTAFSGGVGETHVLKQSHR